MKGGRRAGIGWALLAVAALGCRPDCTPRPGPARPNVILVTIDTLRADHLGCYGNPTVATPALDRLAAEGVRFERAWAQAPITVPSHLSILSSLPLAAHGVVDNDGPLPGPVEVLPDVFRRAGYRTAAFVSAKHVGPEGVLGRVLTGLETYRAPCRVSMPRPGGETTAEVAGWLRGACRDPFFAWVHYYDPHMPYAPPAPWADAYYHDDPFAPRHTSMAGVTLSWFFHDLGDLRRRLGRAALHVRTLKAALGVRTRRVRELLLAPEGLAAHAQRPAERALAAAELATLATEVRRDLPLRRPVAHWLTGVRDLRYPLARYAAAVSYADHAVGELRDALEQLGLAGRTIVVVTADHGESLGEHGVYFDHFGLHEPSLRVPLIVWAPSRLAPARRTDPARGLDVAPTLLGLAALPVPAAMQGRDLFAAAPAPEADAPVLAEAARGLQHMALAGRWKLIRTEQSFHYVDAFAREAGAVELYDLEADPTEVHDLGASRPDVVAALVTRLDGWLAAERRAPAEPPGAPAVPAGVQRALRALGYVE